MTRGYDGKKLGFGFMRLPLLDPNDQGSVDAGKVNEMVDRYIDAGFNYFDTSWIPQSAARPHHRHTGIPEYGDMERWVGCLFRTSSTWDG